MSGADPFGLGKATRTIERLQAENAELRRELDDRPTQSRVLELERADREATALVLRLGVQLEEAVAALRECADPRPEEIWYVKQVARAALARIEE